MQTVSTDSTPPKSGGAKANGKPRRTSARAKSTLHLKDKPPGEHGAADTPVLEMTGMIATAAYYLAERRGFEPGHELDDWLVAEQQVRTLWQS